MKLNIQYIIFVFFTFAMVMVGLDLCKPDQNTGGAPTTGTTMTPSQDSSSEDSQVETLEDASDLMSEDLGEDCDFCDVDAAVCTNVCQ